MIEWIIEKSVKSRFLVIVVGLVVVALGASGGDSDSHLLRPLDPHR